MAGRPRSFDRDEALGKLVDVFWTNGYAGADIDELQGAIGVQRGSFYSAFGGKGQVFGECLGRYFEEQMTPLFQSIADAGGGRVGLAAFLRKVAAFQASQGGRGCMFAAAILNADELDPVAREAADAALKRFNQTLHKAAGGDAALAGFVFANACGLHALASSGASGAKIRGAAEIAATSVETRA